MTGGFVFDLDGTLVDSLPGIARGLNMALESLGVSPHSEKAVRGMVGKGAKDLCTAALAPFFNGDRSQVTEDAIQRLLAEFMRFYPITWQEGTVIYPEISDLLADLHNAGYHLAVLSNKPHVITEPLVKTLFPDIPFSSVMGYSDRFPRKPDPSSLLHILNEWGLPPQNATLIGDSTHDAKTAQNAKTKLVLVSWGYSDRKSLLEYENAPLCDHVGQLYSILLQK